MKVPAEMKWDERLEEADKAKVASYNASAKRLSELRVGEVIQAGPLRSFVAWNLAALQQSLLYRIVALFDGVTIGWNNRSTLSAYLSARALLETIAVEAEFEREVADLLAKKDIRGLEGLARSGIFSSRDPDVVGQAPDAKAKNVLTYLNKLEKQCSGVLKYYLALSERCHPNALGHSYMFAKLDLPAKTYRLSDERDPDKNGLMIISYRRSRK